MLDDPFYDARKQQFFKGMVRHKLKATDLKLDRTNRPVFKEKQNI